jgi:hypothetical protein
VLRESLEATIVIAVLLSLVQAIVLNNPDTGSRSNGVVADEKDKDSEIQEPTTTQVDEPEMDRAALVKKLRIQVCLLFPSWSASSHWRFDPELGPDLRRSWMWSACFPCHVSVLT